MFVRNPGDMSRAIGAYLAVDHFSRGLRLIEKNETMVRSAKAEFLSVNVLLEEPRTLTRQGCVVIFIETVMYWLSMRTLPDA